jgi:hypothetical protein
VIYLEEMIPKFNGNVYDKKIMTHEGVSAVKEAIEFL